MFKPNMMSGSIFAAQYGILPALTMPETKTFPVYAENQAMVESWIKEMNNYVFKNEEGNYSFSHYDSEYNMYWINTPANTTLGTYFRLGYGCYQMLRELRAEGKTDWQFPFVWPNKPTEETLPMPEQEDIWDVYLYFNDWLEDVRELQVFLDKVNERYAEYFIPGQFTRLNGYTIEEKYTPYSGYYTDIVVEVGDYNMNLGMLFEIGVMLCYAYDTNLWNETEVDSPFLSYIPIAYIDDLSGVTKMLKAYKDADELYPYRIEQIEFFSKKVQQYSVTEPIKNKIKALKTLRESRPLLAREQLELDTLQTILDAKDEATIDVILAKIAQTPTDAELRKRLLVQAQAKRDLILDDNI